MKVLPKQFGIWLQDAEGIVTSCPQGQAMIAGLGPGANPSGSGPLQLWQTDVTICASLGCFKRIHVTTDTFSAMAWATPVTSEGSGFGIPHWPGCFAVMGLPQEIRTHNGAGYTAWQTQDFSAPWGVKHSTGIPGNSTRQLSSKGHIRS